MSDTNSSAGAAAPQAVMVIERTYRADRGSVGAVDHESGLRVLVGPGGLSR